MNTIDFENTRIINKTIDYLKIKLINLEFIYEKLLITCPDVYSSTDLFNLDFNSPYTKCFNPFWDIYILNMWTIWNTKHRFDIFTFDKIKIWNIIIPLIEYKSNIAYLELSWMYFKIYDLKNNDIYFNKYEYLSDFFEYLYIDVTVQKILKRIDFNIDIWGLEVFELLDYIKDKETFKGYEVKDLNWIDRNKLNINEWIFKYWKTTTSFTSIWAYHKVIVYDKILDLLKKHMKTKVNWVNPFLSYIKSETPITRVELVKKWESFLHMKDNSILWVFWHIESLFFDYMSRVFSFPLSSFSTSEIETLNWKKIFLAKSQREKNLLHSLTMFKAYWQNIIDIIWEFEFKEIVLDKFWNILNWWNLSVEEIQDIF